MKWVMENVLNNKFIAASMIAVLSGGILLYADVAVLKSKVEQTQTKVEQTQTAISLASDNATRASAAQVDQSDFKRLVEVVTRLEERDRERAEQLKEIRSDLKRLLERR